MLSDRPHRHLVHASGGKQVRRNARRHYGEGQPREELVRVVGAGNVTEMLIIVGK